VKTTTISINRIPVSLQIFIIPGKYDLSRDDFLYKSYGCIVSYAINLRTTFELNLIKVLDYVSLIKDVPIDEYPVVIVGTKADLIQERQVSLPDGELLARKYNVPFFETSSKTGFNVYHAFCACIYEIDRKTVQPLPILLSSDKK